ncbi:hypothetical protein ACFYZ8_34550 [Streptomyces sp. NPDC001668]|uniref:hypothetical protein n=1 Tax=Streptomyces sp. NPDC001668 TaxID=3364598 RepID=UPI0036BD4985
MTNRRDREHDRAVKAYKRAHPGITLDQARAAVAARSGRQPGLPARIPAAPLPRPAERLEGYIQRVAAAVGVQRHRAMELLGLQPGASATERLDHLAAGPLPDHTVRALAAATGMTADQARALTAPLPARPDLEAVRRITEHNFAAGHYRRPGMGKTSTRGLSAAVALALAQQAGMIAPDAQPASDRPGRTPDLEDLARRLLDEQHIRPGGTGKTRTDAGDLARLLAATSGQRPLLFDLPGNEPHPAPYTPVFVDLDWPANATRPPIAPEVLDEVTQALGIGQNTGTHAPPRE